MKLVAIAMLCHSINAAYCKSQGDDSILPWDESPEEQKKSIEYGVQLHLENPETTPEQSHESWLKQKEADGWVYGEVKDMENKVHPCIRPYDELPPEQKAKDYLFKATVNLAKDLPDLDVHLALSSEVVQLRTQLQQFQQALAARPSSTHATVAQKGKAGVVVKYVGNKTQFTDNIYESNLTFEHGQERTVSADLAGKLLKHPEFKRVELELNQLNDSFAAGSSDQQDDTAEVTRLAEQKRKEQEDTENNTLDAIGLVNQLDKDALNDYAMKNFNEKVAKNLSLENARKKVINLIETQGAPK